MKLLSKTLWPRITALAKKNAHCSFVAVAYFGRAGSSLLPLRAGSLLVVDMSEKAVRSGQTDPGQIVKLLKEGVEVHSVQNLHAKVFVLGKHAIIGSANVSEHSAGSLIEAAVETVDKRLVAASRRFVMRKTGEYVTLEYARMMVPLYRPPNFGKGKGTAPKHARLWAVRLAEIDWESEDRTASREGMTVAEKKLSSTELHRVDQFIWHGKPFLGKLQKGDLVLQILEEGRSRYVYPAARVIHIEQYAVDDEARGVVFLEVPKRLKRKRLAAIIKQLGPPARLLKHIWSRLLKNRSLIHALLHLWPRRALGEERAMGARS